MIETDLYPPVRDLLISQDYSVYAEVKSCDVVAQKPEHLLIVELKTALNLTLVRQAVQRQKITHCVYVGIPEPKRRLKSVRESEQILKRLGLGLITVSQSPLRRSAAVQFEPDFEGRINARLRQRLEKELAGRTIDTNVGGSTGTKIYTAYRETAFTLAWMIADCGQPMRVKDLKPAAGTKTQAILYRNHYGWFDRIGQGTYDLTDTGRSALDEYPDLAVLAKRALGADT